MLAIGEGPGPRVAEVRFVGRAYTLPAIPSDWVGLSGGRPAPDGWVPCGPRSLAADAAFGWVDAVRALEEPGVRTATSVCWDADGQLGWVTFERVL